VPASASEVGVVVGKFFPPHRGHEYLISTALQRCRRLHVIVAQRADERPAGEMRLRWLREAIIDPDVVWHLTDDDVPEEPGPWAAKTVGLIGAAPDVCFTSEDYGWAWAEAMGCRHELVDRNRGVFPVSGSAVRADPLGHWDLLGPGPRSYYCRRVVIVGAESSGKTTLARDLAAHFDTVCVPEWARTYGEERGYGAEDWENDDGLFDLIAEHQPASECDHAGHCNRILVCDTDLLATAIWHEAYRGTASPAILDAHDAFRAVHPRALYLLALDDVDWVQDGARNRGSDDPTVTGSRPWFTRRFRDELSRRNEPVVELTGDWGQRFDRAVRAVDAVLAS
jgi:NadR type nicotinamide-nucleotide adenylyltransferase